MELIDALLTTPLAEKSGATTAARIRYQQHWALSEILKRYLAGENCLFIFEYHDDVVILTPASSPNRIEFFQVKTKNGANWSLTELLAQKKGVKGKSLSILGKLYSHLISFGDHTKRLHFVTNAHFSFIKDKEALETSAAALEERDGKKMNRPGFRGGCLV